MKRVKQIVILSFIFAILLGVGLFTYSFFYGNTVAMAIQPIEETTTPVVTPEPPPDDEATPISTSEAPTEAPKIIVAIDPGHGGTDSGADNHGVLESDVNLSIAKMLRDLFAEDPDGSIQVLLTRSEDVTVSLEERTRLANDNAQLFISIHCNIDESSTRRHGALTIFQTHKGLDRPFTSQDLAETVQNALVADLKCNDWGLEYSDELYLLNHSTIPTIITEVGFLSNPEERALLATEDYQRQIAKTLARALLDLAGRFHD